MNEIKLPLFPLNMVLFPGHPLRLQIFEPRYKQMIDTCLRDDLGFGVLLIKKGQEAMGPLAETYPVGCRVKIDTIQREEGGHLHLAAVGLDRFHVRSFDYETFPYLTGVVEPFSFVPCDADSLSAASNRLRRWVERYLQELIDFGRVRVASTDTPKDPEALAYMATAILSVDLRRKQELFSYEDLLGMVTALISLYRLELALVKRVLGKYVGDSGTTAIN